MTLYSDPAAAGVQQQLNEIWRAIRGLSTARTSEATTIDRGDFIVRQGASVIVLDDGSVIVRGGGDVVVEDSGSLFVRGTGGITLEDGSILIARYDSGQPALYFGRLRTGDGSTPFGDGLMIRRRSGDTIAQVYGRDDGTAYVNFDADDIDLFADQIDLTAGERIYLNSTILSQILSSGQAGLGGTTGTYLLPQSGSGTANVRMDTTTGQITWVASTERVKYDIRDLDVDPGAVLGLRPRTWLPGQTLRQCPEWIHSQHPDGECHAGEPVDPPPDAPREVGFVAEEIDALGLGEFVEYDPEGLPVSIRYDRLTAALLPVVQRQQAQITALAEQLAALTERVAVLEPESPDA